MRFKFQYQLFAVQFLSLLIACLLIGFLTSHFLKNYFFESSVNELSEYGVKIADDDLSKPVLDTYQRLLSVKNIHYTILKPNNQIVYPNFNRPLPPSFKISMAERKQLEKGKIISHQMDDRFNQTMSIVYIPILEQNELRGIIILNSPVSGTERVIGKINAYMFYTIIFSVVTALVISFLLSKMQVKRINRLRKATKTVTQGNYDIQLTSGQLDEIDDLTTDFNQMVQALARSKAEINRQEKRRRQFIADVSHEMRTPLTTISGLSEGLVNDLIPADQFPRSLALIEKEAKRLTKLVNENLDYERIISNKVHLQQTSFKVLPFLNTIKDQMLPLVKETGNEIKIDAPESLQIYADYDRLTQIVINVVKNSIQFTKKGTITLQATSNYKETLLTITDTGIGMDPAELTQIWERFYKADLSRTDTKYGEYGIGLTIVKQLVEQHHGRIEVKSKRGEGTTFSLYFPAPSVQ